METHLIIVINPNLTEIKSITFSTMCQQIRQCLKSFYQLKPFAWKGNLLLFLKKEKLYFLGKNPFAPIMQIFWKEKKKHITHDFWVFVCRVLLSNPFFIMEISFSGYVIIDSNKMTNKRLIFNIYELHSTPFKTIAAWLLNWIGIGIENKPEI